MSKFSGNLVIETSPTGDEVFMRGAPGDLRALAKILERLASAAEQGNLPHEHCFSNDWGGYDLAGRSSDATNRAVHHLKIYGLPSASKVSQHGT
jgi:hypothetical protein